jgi:hypothetical protein
LNEVMDAALQSAGTAISNSGVTGLVSAGVKARIIEALFRLAADPKTSFAARALVAAKLHAIGQLQPHDAGAAEIKQRIAAFERDPEKFKPEPVTEVPPGSPIGDDETL